MKQSAASSRPEISVQRHLEYFLRDEGEVSTLHAADTTTFWQKGENVTNFVAC